ncbi:hypothetical protein RIR_jg25455.t1 [Rhizophagus irregularis DAOM 181602=DAOM 197198]|uniref:Uncharacterized protein n=1 Tax=Rhizophagus irregularis (strain DAOM 197198w) TaxID=1432141 RepID=A0A015NEJ0_RHIIW|nr:hypothetical protein RirG_021470 [Rhizophagus irregularis DAOM 197198w]GBC48953.1 hypothetical protein RIR_jg25455.t1 [Rhizophagus irregularis DAOM 181602=DAOM 197198]
MFLHLSLAASQYLHSPWGYDSPQGPPQSSTISSTKIYNQKLENKGKESKIRGNQKGVEDVDDVEDILEKAGRTYLPEKIFIFTLPNPPYPEHLERVRIPFDHLSEAVR